MTPFLLRGAAHELVWVEGGDAARFLQGLLSQDVESLATGEVRRSFFLGPQGKLRALLWVAGSTERILLVSQSGRGQALADELGYYRIRVKAEVRVDRRETVELWGDGAAELTGLGGSRWLDDERSTRVSIPLGPFERVVVAGEVALEGLEPLDPVRADEWRVVAGEPRFGVDVDERTIPQETGLVPVAVSFTKGCYLGQELVARIDSRGHVNRILRRLDIEAGPPPASGARVLVEGGEVGTATSVTPHDGGYVALALLRREVEAGTQVEVVGDGFVAPAVVSAI
jgi:folate-binding protein YgfZ